MFTLLIVYGKWMKYDMPKSYYWLIVLDILMLIPVLISLRWS